MSVVVVAVKMTKAVTVILIEVETWWWSLGKFATLRLLMTRSIVNGAGGRVMVMVMMMGRVILIRAIHRLYAQFTYPKGGSGDK